MSLSSYAIQLLVLSVLIENKVSGHSRQLDVVLLVDTSKYVEENFDLYKSGLKRFIVALGVEENGHRVSIVPYSTEVTVTLNLTDGSSTDRCLSAVDHMPPIPGTRNTHLALAAVRDRVLTAEAGDREHATNSVILITTGSSALPHATLTEANLLKADNVTVFSLGIGRWVSDGEIQFLATKPASFFSGRIHSPEELGDALSAMASKLSSAEDEAKVLECSPLFDIAFIIDASSSISAEDFVLEKEFVDKLVSSFDISPQMSRAALVAFSNVSRIVFNLATYTSYSPMKTAILSVSQTGVGRLVLHKAMRYCRNSIFKNNRLDESDSPIPRILIIITGGKSRFPKRVLEEAALLKQDGVTIFTINVGRQKQPLMSRIASLPPDRYSFNVLQFSQLDMVYSDLVNTTCKELSILTQGTIDEHFEYGTKLPTEECQGISDILFLFQIPDTDESVEILRAYIETIIRYLDIGEDTIRVALTGLNGGRVPITTFNQNLTKNETLETLWNFDTYGTAEHVDEQNFFSEKSPIGWRSDAVKIIVFFHFDFSGKIPLSNIAGFVSASHRQDIMRFVINIGGTSSDLANLVASEPKCGHVIYAPYMDTLMTTAPFLLDRVCEEATPASHPTVW